MKVHTYDDDDLRPGDAVWPWKVIMDIPGDNPDILGEVDNVAAVDKLKGYGAVLGVDRTSCESCCAYVHFRSKNEGRRFIRELNKYLLEKARLIEEARSF